MIIIIRDAQDARGTRIFSDICSWNCLELLEPDIRNIGEKRERERERDLSKCRELDISFLIRSRGTRGAEIFRNLHAPVANPLPAG